jgi:tRNA pseudouridine55 synthase
MRSGSEQQQLSGVIVLDKPAGITSARAVDIVKRALPRGTKIGHAGTLDPFATGVLVLLLGRATRLCETMMDQPKSYEATVKLGATTQTDDPESHEQPTPGVQPLERETLESALSGFRGVIQQRPPAYSAIKVGGQRAYDLARKGKEAALEPRPVTIYRLDLHDYSWPLLRLAIDCGRGTYIRSLARDLGEALGVGGYLTQLRRTRVGPYTIESAVPLDRITRDTLPTVVRPTASL